MKTKSLKTRLIVVIALSLIVLSAIPFATQSAQAVQPSTAQNTQNQEDVGDCIAVAFSSSNADQLRGPDERFETYRVLYSGHHVEIIGKFISPVDEALWWLVSDGSWIPEGVVHTSGDCETVREYSFDELFGLGIDFVTGVIDECVVTSDEETDQQSSPTGDNPTTQTASLFNFTINAQLVITLEELQWWLTNSGLWVPAGSVDTSGPCDTVPLIQLDDLEELGVTEEGEVVVCTILIPNDVAGFDNPNGDSTTFVSFDTTISNTFGAFEGVGQYEDDEGQLWWLLENGQWVNNEDVIVHGPCGDLPTVMPETDDTCVVHSTEAGVRVRVGPGQNRGIFTALPTDSAFEVIGKFTDENGDIWWKLDTSELDPENTAESLWVAASAVTTEGDCSDVPDVDSSPFVFSTNPTNDGNIGDGSWGSCGSCDSCGYDSDECVTSPSGQCLWDPTTCRGIPQGDPNCLGFAVAVTGSEPGSVAVSPATNCITTFGTGGYLPGTSMTAMAVGGGDFAYWSGCSEDEGDTTSWTMSASCTLYANWY